jgi:hypothetical protein
MSSLSTCPVIDEELSLNRSWSTPSPCLPSVLQYSVFCSWWNLFPWFFFENSWPCRTLPVNHRLHRHFRTDSLVEFVFVGLGDWLQPWLFGSWLVFPCHFLNLLTVGTDGKESPTGTGSRHRRGSPVPVLDDGVVHRYGPLVGLSRT